MGGLGFGVSGVGFLKPLAKLRSLEESPGKHGFYSDLFWTPLIAQALAIERKKDSEMAGGGP